MASTRKWDSFSFLFGFVVLVGILVLTGWVWNIPLLKSVLPGDISMKPNTAIGLSALSLSGFLLNSAPTRRRHSIGLVLSVVVLLLAVLTLSEYLFHFDFKIDEAFFSDPEAMKTRWPPGRFAPVTGLCFIFIGMALILRHFFQSPRLVKVSQGLVLTAWLVSFQALVGYASGVSYNFGSAFYTQMAIHTAFLIVVLTTAILLSRRHEGYIQILASDEIAGRIGRRLLASAVIVPPLVNLLQLEGIRLGWYDSDFGVLLRVVGNVVFFSWIAFQTGASLWEADTKRRAAEKAQMERTEELRKALHARDELLSICSHELRTPIASMKLQAQMTKRNFAKGDINAFAPEHMKKLVDQSDRQLTRLALLIDEMLEFSRLGSGRFHLSRANFDLKELVDELEDRFRSELEEAGCSLSTRTASVQGYWDRLRLEQVLVNLITNAMKYGEKKPIELSLHDAGDEAIVEVRDHGIGIGREDLERIFRPYERAVSVSHISGLGLGLFISRRIVQTHGGKLEVQSDPGKGAVFKVTLPKATKETV